VCQIPLVIGVSGHCDLRQQDIPEIQRLLKNIFCELTRTCPHTPLLLLSPLAEGADRLAARVAIELGIRLVTPLPLPLALYEEDFISEESKNEFRMLCARAERTFDLPLVAGNAEDAVRIHGPARDEQYAQLGAFISQHSQVLIAIWNGLETNLIGGTAQIVRFKLEGVPARYGFPTSPLDTVEAGPVYHIVALRRKDYTTWETPLSLRKLFPRAYGSDAEEFFSTIYRRLDAFNRDMLLLAGRTAARRAISRDDLLRGSEATALPGSLKQLCENFALADTLAMHFQKLSLRTLVLLFLLGFLAALFLNIYSCFDHRWHWLAFYLITVGGGTGWYLLMRRGDWQNKYQDYRALAEGVRVQFFWRMAGIRDPVAIYYLRKQKGELDWIRTATRIWDLISGGALISSDTLKVEWTAALELIRQNWIDDQHAYFGRATQRDRRRLFTLQRLMTMLFGTLIALAAAELVMGVWRLDEGSTISALVFAMNTAPLVFGLLGGYIEKRRLAEQIKQYSRMELIFKNALSALSRMQDRNRVDQACDLLKELGCEALAENGDWLLLHRARPIETHK
jgi:hypothetical protein